ncbi:hypothetical protein A6R68_18274, partial [Neotoma lepida]
ESTGYKSCSERSVPFAGGVKKAHVYQPANSPSSGWSEKLLKTSERSCASGVRLTVLCSRQVKSIWLALLKTLTYVLSTSNV